MTLKQIIQLESIPCVYLQDILKRLLAKVCFDVSFMCLSRFVAIYVTFNNLCCWTSCCGLVSHIHLRVTDQTWQTGPNESVLYFKVVFVVCWHQIAKLVQVVYITVSLFLLKLHNSWSYVCIMVTLKQIINLWCIYKIFWRNGWQRFVLIFFLCAFLNLLDFGSLLTIYAVERNVVSYCHAYV